MPLFGFLKKHRSHELTDDYFHPGQVFACGEGETQSLLLPAVRPGAQELHRDEVGIVGDEDRTRANRASLPVHAHRGHATSGQ